MKIIAIVQARLGSKRFPKKIIQKIGNYSAIELLLKRLSKSNLIEKIIVATTTKKEDVELIKHINELGYDTFSGSDEDVLDRFYQIALIEKPDIIIRITGDCPFIEPNIVNRVIYNLIETKSNYCSNNFNPTFPDGFDVEAFDFESFKIVWENANEKYDKEHVTPFYYKNPNLFKISSIENIDDLSSIRLTLDEQIDLEVIRNVFSELGEDCFFDFKKIEDLIKQKLYLFMPKNYIKRNQ